MSRSRSFLKAGAIYFIAVTALSWHFRFELAGALIQKKAAELKARYLAASPEGAINAHWTQILEDDRALSKDPIFSAGSGGRSDASPYLNSRVSWPGIRGPLALPPEVAALLKSNENFLALQPDWNKLRLDFSWLSALQQFDTWNFDRSGPAYPENRIYRIQELPEPDYEELIDWAKLRLLYGRDLSDPGRALQDVRQLARLIMTHESMMSSSVALALLDLEGAFYFSLDPQLQARTPWQPISIEEQRRARRFFLAQGALLDPRLSTESFNRAAELKTGVCQRLREAMFYAIGVRRVMKAERPEAYARIDAWVGKTEGLCRDGYLRAQWANPNAQGIFKPGEDVFQMQAQVSNNDASPKRPSWLPLKASIEEFERHPSVALPVLYTLLNSMQQDFLKPYEDGP